MLDLRNAAGNIVFQFFDGVLLFGDNRFDHIANADHANDSLLVQNRQMTNALVGHQLHTVFDRFVPGDGHHLSAHQLLNPDLVSRFIERDAAGIVAF